MEKPIFGWAGSAITGRASRARAVASRVRLHVFMVVRPFIVVGKTQRGAVETVERPSTPCAQICRANVTAATSCRELAREEREFVYPGSPRHR
jgi:hypothetical protein